MIEAIEIFTEDSEPFRVPIADVFAELGPEYAAPPHTVPAASENQIRLQLSWPRLRLEIAKHGAHQRLAQAHDPGALPGRFQLRPIHSQPVAEPRRPLHGGDTAGQCVRAVLVFSTEGQGIEMAYIHAHSDPALILLLSRLHHQRRFATVEFPSVPVETFVATPVRQAIHEFGRGRLYPGPDLVRGGGGPRLSKLLPVPIATTSSGSTCARSPVFASAPE